MKEIKRIIPKQNGNIVIKFNDEINALDFLNKQENELLADINENMLSNKAINRAYSDFQQ